MFMKPVTKLSAMFDSSDYKYEVYRKVKAMFYYLIY